ncbi:RNA-directed DNA polymerase from mobile element jockey [Caerostris extrusa]|uniref:RNA-directed DNA polymerase from mobile element jockey n=1 Tax=Caerostris extrusa TaxID=172846 RepID=A0AAV4X0N0_CAEEX|nr:RNA-directed DNA polymerase from mobile element jockey [Caerostris extrusa]
MISAAATNEMAERAKQVAQRLSCGIVNGYKDTEARVKTDLLLENRLTLWKIYIFNRSLIITSFGTLLTYAKRCVNEVKHEYWVRRRLIEISRQRHISHKHIPTPPLATIQATIIQLNLPNPTALISTYIPPQKKNPSNPNRHLFPINDLLTIHNSFSSYFIAGDLNCHNRSWNCSRANPFGIQLFKFTQHHNLHIAAPPTPTRFDSVTPSTIDIAIIKNFSHHCLATSISAMTSAHNPVLFNIDFSLPNNNIPKRFIPNWEKFNYLLSTASFTPTDLNTQHGIENSINHLTQLITTCYDASCKSINTKITNCHISSSLRSKIIIKNRLRKAWQTTRHPIDKTNYINFNKTLQQEIKIERNTNWNNFLTTLSPRSPENY